jgi:hypothetical protein
MTTKQLIYRWIARGVVQKEGSVKINPKSKEYWDAVKEAETKILSF